MLDFSREDYKIRACERDMHWIVRPGGSVQQAERQDNRKRQALKANAFSGVLA